MSAKSGKIRLLSLAVVAVLVCLYLWCSPKESQVPLLPDDTLLEIPSYTSDNNVISHIGYTTCYNNDLRIPEWVAWELTAEELEGDLEVYRNYSEDPDMSGPQAINRDYVNSGYTHGHMAPVGDMKWSGQAIDESNYLTNMCPQTAELNNGDWEYLESRCRKAARKYGRVWITCGPLFTSDHIETIGRNNVAVPDAFFKVMLTETDGKYHSIGFIYRNDQSSQPLADCAMTVNEVETKTGLDFFPALPDDIENNIESEYDLYIWK